MPSDWPSLSDAQCCRIACRPARRRPEATLRQKAQVLVEGKEFQMFFMVLILVNTAGLCLEHYNPSCAQFSCGLRVPPLGSQRQHTRTLSLLFVIESHQAMDDIAVLNVIRNN